MVRSLLVTGRTCNVDCIVNHDETGRNGRETPYALGIPIAKGKNRLDHTAACPASRKGNSERPHEKAPSQWPGLSQGSVVSHRG